MGLLVDTSYVFRLDQAIKAVPDLKVWHPSCVRSIIQSCSVYISIYIESHETQQLYIISSDI